VAPAVLSDASRGAGAPGKMLLAATLFALAGCSGATDASTFNPVDWWHGLEGGRIAQARPPPPNADAPYPNLGMVPDRPKAPDAAMHVRVAGALATDKRNAQYAAVAAPIPTVPPPARRPAPAAPAGDEQPNASLAAANAPPQGTPASAAKPPPTSGTSAAAAGGGDVPMPAIPEAPPPAPRIGGVNVPAVTAPTVAPPAPPAPPPPPPVVNGAPVPIPFAVGSAILSGEALAPLKQLAQRRGAASVAVTGFGEAGSSETAAQIAALPLALDRARAVAARLQANGVPFESIRIAAEPQGTGAAARLVN
jgi:outer membrane protein OmpA-like peptidoglycan-associated protein